MLDWTEHLRRTLLSYDEPLLRQVSNKLCKPRNHWPAQELIDRCLATVTNVAVLDRRLKDLDMPARTLLALIAHSRQTHWQVGNLVEMLVTLGFSDGLGVVQSLLDAGLLYPSLFPLESSSAASQPLTGKNRLKSFTTWLAQALPPIVFAHPMVMERSVGNLETLPECPGAVVLKTAQGQEADGLEWLLRLAILWQQVIATPLRRTQQGDFFKRDSDRLQADPLLSTPPIDSLIDLPDAGLFTVAFALASGVLQEIDGEIRSATFPPVWNDGLSATIAALWSVLAKVESWSPSHGWQIPLTPGNPYPSAYLLSLLLLGRLPEGSWASPEALEEWVVERHPYWNSGQQVGAKNARAADKIKRGPETGLARFLLGVAYPLRLLQAAKDGAGQRLLRLSELGQWVFGLAREPQVSPPFPQTLLVQPNLEILAYRQGLTPSLIVALTKFASWKGLGAACTLQLEPSSVYRALETGETLGSLVQTLEQHGMKAVPPSVLDSLRTWSNKRDRISIYPAAALFEFPGPAELADALARGLPAVRLTDRLAIVPNESAIDYRHFRLTGTRDYCLPPEKCVDVEADGVTMSVDLARSDLLLETEVQGLAEPVNAASLQGRRLYRLTPASLAAARHAGWELSTLETWFQHRTGLPLSPAGHLLFSAADLPPLEMRRQVILHAASSLAADGLQQWPATRALIQARLGPTALAVAEQHVEELRKRCQELGIKLIQGEG
jgi:Helicase conserved C-terminal domain